MSGLNAKNIKPAGNTKNRPPALEAGTYPAALVQLVGIGVQEQRPFKGEPKNPIDEIMLTYELSDEFLLDEDGKENETKPRWVSERLPFHSLESDLANSTKRYMAMDSSMKHEGNFVKLIGTPCLVTVTADKGKKDDTIYNNVKSVQEMRQKDKDKHPGLVNEPKVFDFYGPDLDVFQSLSKFVQDKITSAVNFEGSKIQNLLEGGPQEPENKSKDEDQKEPQESDNDGEDW